jgi:hypothetical protein
MGLNYFSNSAPNNTAIIIPNRTYNYGNMPINLDDNKEKNRLRINSRKKSCDSNSSNLSEIFQKTLNSHLNKRNEENPHNNNSTISTTTSISGSSNNEDQKTKKNINLSPIKNNRDHYDLRKSYYHRLIHKNIQNMNKTTIKNNTIFIFDWDDTLFFTTHINPSENNTFFYESQSEKKFMNRIEFYVSEILNKALSKGEVFIITNSGDGWVHACAQFYYPNLIPILEKINIISARDLYQKEYPNDPTTWKIKAFNDLKKRFNFEKCIVSNIICIGDNNCEIIAAQKLGEEFKNCLVKTIKFREKPNLKELIKQIILINEQILRVYNYPKSLTIQVNKMKNPKK